MKNGLKITQEVMTSKEDKRVGYCSLLVYINGAFVRVKVIDKDKPLFNRACRNVGFVVGCTDTTAVIPQKVIEIGE